MYDVSLSCMQLCAHSFLFFFFKQKTAYEMRISDWSSDVCSSDLTTIGFCNTRSLAELIFQDLWKVNAMNLPIGVHHGSLAREARRKVEIGRASGRERVCQYV